MNTRIVLLSVGLLFLWTAANAQDKAFDPSHQQSWVSSHNNVTVTLVGQSEALKLRVQRSGSNMKPLTVSLPESIAQVDSFVWISGNRLAVLGRVNSSEEMLAIVDMARETVDDNFLGYDMTFSPNDRYVAFIKYFPPHGMPNPEDRIRVYDLTRSAGANRPVHSYLQSDMEAGTPVYPTLSYKEESARSNTDVAEADAYHVASSFKWSADSKRFAILVLHGEHELALVSSSPSGDVSVANVSAKCATHCLYARGWDLSFNDNGGISFYLKGTGKYGYIAEHVEVSGQNFSQVSRR